MAKVVFDLPDLPVFMQVSFFTYNLLTEEKDNERKFFASVLPGDHLTVYTTFDD